RRRGSPAAVPRENDRCTWRLVRCFAAITGTAAGAPAAARASAASGAAAARSVTASAAAAGTRASAGTAAATDQQHGTQQQRDRSSNHHAPLSVHRAMRPSGGTPHSYRGGGRAGHRGAARFYSVRALLSNETLSLCCLTSLIPIRCGTDEAFDRT